MTAGHPLQADEILSEHQPHSYLPVVGPQPRAREDLTSYCPNQYDQLEIHIYLLDIVYIWSTDWHSQYTDKHLNHDDSKDLDTSYTEDLVELVGAAEEFLKKHR